MLVLIITPAVLIAIWAVGLKFPTHLYSPGDLCNDHQHIKNCNQCHIPFKGADSGLCMTSECHTTERLSRLSNKLLSDLHSSYSSRNCLDCHIEHKGVMGKITKPFDHKLLVSSILNQCVSCHKADYQKAHPTRYNDDCKACHISTTKWNLISFDHDKYFPLTGDHYVSCETCHQNDNYKQYTCLNCHEHNTPHIRHEHEEHGIYDYGDCLRCHQMSIKGKVYGTPKVRIDDDWKSEEESEDDD